jgi:hypothetical protein
MVRALVRSVPVQTSADIYRRSCCPGAERFPGVFLVIMIMKDERLDMTFE